MGAQPVTAIPPVLAFDPGGRKSGVVLRHRERLLGWKLVRRVGEDRMPPDGHYLREVIAAGVGLLRTAGIDPADRDRYVVGVETVAWWPQGSRKRPQAPRDQRGLYGTAMVYGAVLLRWPDAIVVDSGRGVANYHPQAYPEPIRAPGKGSDQLVDVRAAWDHSHATETAYLTRIREARR
jgi:hypothetical protein